MKREREENKNVKRGRNRRERRKIKRVWRQLENYKESDKYEKKRKVEQENGE